MTHFATYQFSCVRQKMKSILIATLVLFCGLEGAKNVAADEAGGRHLVQTSRC